MELLPIHHYPQYLEDCCTLINEEWPRSRTARMRTLESSCDSLPTCLILVSGKEVLGHSKVSALHHLPAACFVESVVIQTEKRGRGLGRILMAKTEEYAKSLGMQTVYLTTKGQEGFYSKLGYSVCKPIAIYGCPVNSLYSSAFTNAQTTNHLPNRNISTELCNLSADPVIPSLSSPVAFPVPATDSNPPLSSHSSCCDDNTASGCAVSAFHAPDLADDTTALHHEHCALVPPPPPPPLPPLLPITSFSDTVPKSISPSAKTYMKKSIV